MPLIVLVEFDIVDGKQSQFLARVKQQAADSLALEDKCSLFDVATSPDGGNTVLLYEIYDDEAAFGEHLASDHFKAFDAEVAGWVADKRVSKWDGPLT